MIKSPFYSTWRSSVSSDHVVAGQPIRVHKSSGCLLLYPGEVGSLHIKVYSGALPYGIICLFIAFFFSYLLSSSPHVRFGVGYLPHWWKSICMHLDQASCLTPNSALL